MKKLYKKRFCSLSLFTSFGLIAGCLFLSEISFGQKYYTKFPNPAGRAYVINASGTNCTAPAVQDSLGFADTLESTFTSFKTTKTDSFSCNVYHFVANLNLPADTFLLGAGYKVGFRIQVPSGISLDSLQKYTVVSTYNSDGGKLVESRYNQFILGVDSNLTHTDWLLYFTTTMPFNTLELNVNPNITPLKTNFEFRVLYGFATMGQVLPAVIDNFRLTVRDGNVNVSWQSLSETNVSGYRVERSSNGGSSYSAVATLAAKGGTGNLALSYAYNDLLSTDGSYLYRIVTVNRDGSSKATGSLTAVIIGGSRLFLYPSVVKAGQSISVKTTQTGLVTLRLFDAQGRVVKQERISSGGQFTIGTGGLSAGMYHVKLVSATGSVLQAKIVID